MERHGELRAGQARYSPEVRAELEAMSPATIDRYLAPARAKDPLRGISTTKPSPLLRSSIQVRKAGDEVEQSPGFFEGDTVAHYGPTPSRDFYPPPPRPAMGPTTPPRPVGLPRGECMPCPPAAGTLR